VTVTVSGVVALWAAALAVTCGPGPAPENPEIVIGVIVVGGDGQRWADAFSTDALGGGRIVREDRRRLEGSDAVGDTIRRQVSDGAEIVLCLGRACSAAVMAEAPRHRGTRFVSVPPVRSSPNLSGVELRGAGAGYLAGVAASVVSDSRRPVGLLEGSPDPWFDEVARGFEEGVAAASPARRRVVRTNDVLGLVEAGVTIALVSPTATWTTPETTGAPAAILADGRPEDLERPGVVGVVLADRGELLRRAVQGALDGGFARGRRVYGLESGFVDLRLDLAVPEFAGEAFRQRMDEARAAVLSGIVAVESFGM
jgi:basic membrane lipoprotein Med (substrate-binding protein (PBP1-ABC) superfamily)